MVERHGVLYADELGWDETFEGLVAEIVGAFARSHDPQRERAFVAELDGRRAGCVLCVREDGETARLRILLVEPWARGHGLGSRLVDECIAFARSAGYARMVLWTNDVLVAARRIYERAGFVLVDEGHHRAFGHELVEQTWTLEL
jgi:GNAT superfamily N-acetyltransferase